ncbi:MAG TPA: hypothetical protein P5205_17500 [Candidatus Paceibacterota bacterium]|nr:hypothetical protein [Candidatus Paceibacterota bacterium]
MKTFAATCWVATALSPSGATFTVTTVNDGGPGSLRQAMWDANTNLGPDIIAFNMPGRLTH